MGASRAAWPAGVDDPQHRAQRHQRLAGADLALQQPVHRVRLREVGVDLLPHHLLTAGEVERQPGVEGGQQRAVAAVAGHRPEGADRPSAAAEHELGDQRLLEAEVALGGEADLLVVRGVDAGEGTLGVTQLVRTADGPRHDLGKVVDHRAGEGHGALHVPRLQTGGERVDREEPAHRLDHRDVVRAVGAGADEHHLGVGELPGVAEHLRLADEDALAPLREGGGPPLGVLLVLGEEGHREPEPIGAHHGLDAVGGAVGAAVLVGLHLRLGDLADDGEHLARLQVVELGEAAGVEVAAREVAQQVADGLEAERVELLDLRRATEDLVDPRVDRDHASNSSRPTRPPPGAGSGAGHRRTPRRRHEGGSPRPTPRHAAAGRRPRRRRRW